MRYYALLAFLIMLSTLSYAQDDTGDNFLNPHYIKTEKNKARDERKELRKNKLEAWRQKPWHIYLGVDAMFSYREQSMRFVDRPSPVHNYYHASTDEGTFSGRIYLGCNFKLHNNIEIGFENLPHELVFYYQPSSDPLSGSKYINRIGSVFLSVAYRRDILPRSKVFKLYPGAFFGIDFQGNETGGIGHFDMTGSFNGSVTHVIWDSYYKIPYVPVIGPTLDADVNFWHFTLGLKFKLYYDPFVIRGENVQVQYNGGPVQKFQVQSPLFNFNWGLGLRYTF